MVGMPFVSEAAAITVGVACDVSPGACRYSGYSCAVAFVVVTFTVPMCSFAFAALKAIMRTVLRGSKTAA